jgi:hypothetical protein
MTRDDIIKMAREAGFNPVSYMGANLESFERFAALVATAVAEPVQEPVAWANSFDLQNFDMKVRTGPDLHHTVPLYTAPPKQWVGLTAYEIQEIYSGNQHWGNFACAIEAKLKEKNT